MKQVEYLNKTVLYTIAPSQIHGVGVFALFDIRKGTKLTDYTFFQATYFNFWFRRFHMKEDEFMKIVPEVRERILDRVIFSKKYNEKYFEFISPNRYAVLHVFMNHSDKPNSDGVYALCDIKKGEEITENFNHQVKDMHQLSKKHFSFLG